MKIIDRAVIKTPTEELLNGINAVIFDLDGTLIDSMWMWKQIDIDYLASKGKPFPPDLQDTISGMSFSETAVYFKETFGIEDDLDTIKKCWNDMAWEMYSTRVTLKEGALEFLKYLILFLLGVCLVVLLSILTCFDEDVLLLFCEAVPYFA